MEEADNKSCGICSVEISRYQCPRCNILYCSAGCYKNPKHSNCSEQFYEECVRNEMSSLEPDAEESRKKMLDILKRLQESCDEDLAVEELDSDDEVDEDDDTDLAERLKGVNLDEADSVWEKLTDTEKRQFEELLKSNDVTEILPEFEPWWSYKDERKVVDLEEVSPFEEIYRKKCPEIYKKIVPFSKISKSQPAPTVCFNLANVLSAYVYVVRYFNGDIHDFISQSTISIITISKNLSDNENFCDFPSAIKSVFLEISNCDFIEGSNDVEDVIISDVKNLFDGPDESNKNFYVLSVLSDVHSLFSKAVKCYNVETSGESSMGVFSKRFPESGISALPQVPKMKIKNCLKKIEYYMSWSVEFCNSSVKCF